MTVRQVSPRAGISLLEVLTAIFIMGIGMMALLTLFPAGALSMARAVRDDRAATIAANAAGIAAAFDLRSDGAVVAALNNATYQPDYANAPGVPSNPVLVDPQIVAVSTLLDPYPPSPGIQRITPSFAGTPPRVARYFTFQDEISLDTLGNVKGGTVDRPGTYSLAYMVRRPLPNIPTLVEMSVLIFSQRVIDYADGETAYPLPSDPPITVSQNTITIPYNTVKAPDIRRRSWVMDTSYTATTRIINGDFYRVENVTDVPGTPRSLQLEVDRPLKTNCSRIVHFRDLIAVIDRGSSW